MFNDNGSKISPQQLLGLVIAITVIMLFLVGCGNTTSTPVSEEVQTKEPPRTGDVAPDFTLPDSNGDMLNLSDELNDNRTVALVFYYAYN